jgi:predicted RNA binding protein YcfA (HicA-like mRNA interferase family)
MKRTDLLKLISAKGALLVRHGGNHDIYIQPRTGNTEPVPRHNEIKEFMAKKIIRNLS